MLADRYLDAELRALRSHLLPLESFRPAPTIDERAAWEKVSPDARQYYLEQAGKYLTWTWPPLPASLYMDFPRTGRRATYETPYFARRTALAILTLAECLENKGRFLDAIIDGIWYICEESVWNIPPHVAGCARPNHPLRDKNDPVVELFSAETASLLAWVHYLVGSRLAAVTPIINERIKEEVERRIIDVFLKRNDYWWMGFHSQRVNNWNPWVNASCLHALLLLVPDPEKRLAGTAKALRSLDRFIAAYPPDGGCDEGPSYWSHAAASLFDCLEILYAATSGWINIYDEPLIQNMGRYIYRAWISGRYFVNFADCGALLSPPVDLISRFGRRIGDRKMQAFAAHLFNLNPQPDAGASYLTRRLPALLNHPIHPPDPAEAAESPYLPSVWLPDTAVMVAREDARTGRGWFLAAKGGHNNESHNHNDVGSFIVFADGRPVFIDPGAPQYTAKTFSAQRYELWPMQSSYHNLPEVNGVQQRQGREYQAHNVVYRTDGDKGEELELDIAPAYPEEAGILEWRRTVRLEREPVPSVRIKEEFKLNKPSGQIILNLITPLAPESALPGEIILPLPGERPVSLRYDPTVLQPTINPIDMEDDPRMTHTWRNGLVRLQLSVTQKMKEGRFELVLTRK
ncbi:MAG TPA: heparinase [Firmicutes bacterium]|nr:heparinase [Bacillota bacterium]